MNCRKDVKDLSSPEKTAYVNAVLALKSAPSKIPAAVTAGGTGRYDDYVWMHNQVGHGAHRGPAFGPWHREFLKQFERDLQIVSGDPHMTIPFWDWTKARTSADPGWPFTDDFMGGFGNAATGFVETGPFSTAAAWPINIKFASETRLKRRRAAPGFSLPTASVATTGFPVTPYDVSPFHSDPSALTAAQRTAQANAAFRKYLEWLLHDGVHVWIGGLWDSNTDGGHMTFPDVAVNDPIFFLHHCMVDRLWAVWQQKNPGFGYEPAAGANAGHKLNDTMVLFGDPSHFNAPLANRPADVLDWHALGFWYTSDLPAVTLLTPSVTFGDVPENLTTYRPIQFSVRTCRQVRLRITALTAGTNFAIPPSQGDEVPVDHDHDFDPVTGNLYVQFQALGTTGVNQAATATVRAYIVDSDGYFAATVGGEHTLGTWDITLSAKPVARPRTAIGLVVDRSGSMGDSAGPMGTKYDLLKSSLVVVADILRNQDAVALVSYDDLVTTIFPVQEMGPLPPTPGMGRDQVIDATTSPDLVPRGATGIGLGMIQGAGVLDNERTAPGTPYAQFAMVVMTDGNENVHPYVTEPPVTTAVSPYAGKVFAVGLGAPGNVSEGTLGAISNYMLVTGSITTAEQRFRLTKYFLQILAGATGSSIVVDPQGELRAGEEHRIPFDISEADAGLDVIALSPIAPLLEMRLEAPDGSVIDAGTASPNVQFHVGQEDAFYRLLLPARPGDAPGSQAGTWTAVLRLRKESIQELLRKMPDLQKVLERLRGLEALPYSVIVQSFSNLLLNVHVQQDGPWPGQEIGLYAELTEYGLPVANRARVVVELTRPGGSVVPVALHETEPGRFKGSFDAALPGLYTCRFKASGTTLGRKPFQREETRTASFYREIGGTGDGPGGKGLADGGDGGDRENFCRLVRCLLSSRGVDELLAKHGLDPKGIEKCFAEYCRDERRKAAVSERRSQPANPAEPAEPKETPLRDLENKLFTAAPKAQPLPGRETHSLKGHGHEHGHFFVPFVLDERGNIVEADTGEKEPNPEDGGHGGHGEPERPEPGGHDHGTHEHGHPRGQHFKAFEVNERGDVVESDLSEKPEEEDGR